jgi:hypothetical protein
MRHRQPPPNPFFSLRPPTWRIGATGLEVIVPTPGAMRLMLVIFGSIAALVAGVTELLYRLDELPFSLLAMVLDPWTLAVVLPLGIALLMFDRHSNERWLFGTTELLHETRVGHYVVTRDRTPLAAIETVDVLPGGSGHAATFRERGAALPYRLGGDQSEADAHALAQALREWLAAPAATRTEPAGDITRELPRIILTVLKERAGAAIPLAFAAFALITAASAWNLRSGGTATMSPYDAIADGELVRYRFIASMPAHAEQRAWLAVDTHIEIGVQFRDAGGSAHTLWLRTPDAMPFSSLVDYRLATLARHVGLPHVEWALPAEASPLFDPANPSFADLPARRTRDTERHADWIEDLDAPVEYAAITAVTTPPDWRVAYASTDPRSATLARLDAIVQQGRKDMPAWLPWVLIIGTGLPGFVFLAFGLGGGRMPVIGAVAVVAALPLWAAYAAPLAQRLGITPAIQGVVADMLAAGLPAQAQEARSVLQAATTPTERRGDIVVRWTPDTSSLAPVLPRFGLLPAPAMPVQPSANRDPPRAYEAARDALNRHAAETIAALDDATLVGLIRTLEGDRARYHTLNAPRVNGLCLARLQPQRSESTQRWIEHGIGNVAVCNDTSAPRKSSEQYTLPQPVGRVEPKAKPDTPTPGPLARLDPRPWTTRHFELLRKRRPG